ncbi:MAG TPA: class I SAM-dependent methyltransferase [Elusimicrobiota bacterium]|jgi:SAM-dependent methyltransferase|nr:class I SAM-dependent methyltransferase [Elusimicrobiota bacterium]
MNFLDPKKRFTATVEDYQAYRPGYPDALVDWILSVAGVPPGGKAADVGSGTGISTRLFAARGLDVVGVEPNDEMRAAAEARGGARYRKGDASNTGLPSGGLDLVFAAQAFHWFDLEPAFAEFKRVLKPEGWCAAFWNGRAGGDPLMRDYEALLLEFSSEYAEVRRKYAVLDEIGKSSRVRDWTRAAFPNSQSLDLAGFLGRVHSSSYVAHGVARRAELDRALEDLFSRRAAGGRVEFRYVVEAACFRLR